MWVFGVFFFFQAEDGIRDDLVTGVQTCALPIYGDGNLTIGYSERRHGHQLKRQGQGQKCAKRKQQKLHRRNPPGTAHKWVVRDHRSNATKLSGNCTLFTWLVTDSLSRVDTSIFSNPSWLVTRN